MAFLCWSLASLSLLFRLRSVSPPRAVIARADGSGVTLKSLLRYGCPLTSKSTVYIPGFENCPNVAPLIVSSFAGIENVEL